MQLAKPDPLSAFQTIRSKLPLSVAVFALLVLLPLPGKAAEPYELVRGPDNPLVSEAQAPMCRELIKSLNEFKNEPPMACRRKFDSKYTEFSLPDWKPLNDQDALQAALALEKGLAQKGPPKDVEARFAEYASKVRKVAAAGQLSAWEARFDVAKNGEQARVVLVSNGECGTKYDFSWNDPIFGVLLPDRFEVDPRYQSLAHYGGDLFLYKGTAYIARWSNVPSATLFDRVGPRGRRHRGYLLVQSMSWVSQGRPLEAAAGVFDTVCQIGYERLHSTDKRGKP